MLPVAEGDNFQGKNEMIHFRRSLDRVKIGFDFMGAKARFTQVIHNPPSSVFHNFPRPLL